MLRRMVEAEQAAGDKYEAEVKRLFSESCRSFDIDVQRGFLKASKLARHLAGSHRGMQLRAQTRLDDLAMAKLSVSVQILGHPDFDRAFELVARIVDGLVPGLSQVVEEGIVAFEDGGEDGLRAWQAAQAARLEVDSGSDEGPPALTA